MTIVDGNKHRARTIHIFLFYDEILGAHTDRQRRRRGRRTLSLVKRHWRQGDPSKRRVKMHEGRIPQVKQLTIGVSHVVKEHIKELDGHDSPKKNLINIARGSHG